MLTMQKQTLSPSLLWSTVCRFFFFMLLLTPSAFANFSSPLSASVPKKNQVYLTIIIDRSLPLLTQATINEIFGATSDLRGLLGHHFGSIKFREVIATNRESAMSSLKTILAPEDVIVGMNVQTHGSSDNLEDGESHAFLSEIGELSAHDQALVSETEVLRQTGFVSSEFEDFFSHIRLRFSRDAAIVFTSCSLLEKDPERSAGFAQGVAQYFGITEGSVYLSETLDHQSPLGPKDYLQSKFSREGVINFLRASFLISTLLATFHPPHSIDGLVELLRIGLSTVLSYEVVKPLSGSIHNFLHSRVAGALILFEKGKPIVVEIKDKYRQIRQVFGGRRSQPIIRECRFAHP